MAFHMCNFPNEIIYKIISYVDPKPTLYMNMAMCSRRFYELCTSDRPWQRFNLYGLDNIYHHFKFLSSTCLSDTELEFYRKPASEWGELISKGVDIANFMPYTQLMIILDERLFVELMDQVKDRRVMRMAVLEPGNLWLYASQELKLDEELARASFKSRQDRRMLEPMRGWSAAVNLAWHLAYAGLDYDFQAPYSVDLYKSIRWNMFEERVRTPQAPAIPHRWTPDYVLDIYQLGQQNYLKLCYVLGLRHVVRVDATYYELDNDLY